MKVRFAIYKTCIQAKKNLRCYGEIVSELAFCDSINCPSLWPIHVCVDSSHAIGVDYPRHYDKPANRIRLSDFHHLSSPAQCIARTFGKAHGSRPVHHLSKPLTLYTAWLPRPQRSKICLFYDTNYYDLGWVFPLVAEFYGQRHQL